MDFSQTITEIIDLRAYTALWYWVLLAMIWALAAQLVLGIPWDIVLRSQRGGQAEADLTDMARVMVNRILHFADEGGLALAGIGAAVLTSLGLLGFVWRVELAQAVFFLMVPTFFFAALSVRTARGIARSGAVGDELRRRLRRHRMVVQGTGAVWILIAGVWGVTWALRFGPV